MDALAEEVELLVALAVDDDLPVEHVAPGGEAQLGEVAGQVAPVARLEGDAVTVDEGDAAKAVPLRLEGPVVGAGQCAARARELREDRRLERKRHGFAP